MSDNATMDEASWFATWVNQRLGACLTFARGKTWDGMLEGFGILSDDRLVDLGTRENASDARLEVGNDGEWGWAIEHFTTVGSSDETLCLLSGHGGEAISLALTQTINVLLYAANGSVVSGFDLTVPHIRYGSDPHRFDSEIEQAIGNPGGNRDPAAVAVRFVWQAFGLMISPKLIESATHTARI